MTDPEQPPPQDTAKMSEPSMERVINAIAAYDLSHPDYRMYSALQADDLWRASHPAPRQAPEGEPKLPEGVAWRGNDGHCPRYHHNRKGDIYQRASEEIYSPSDLRAIADHMEWRERQAAPVVTETKSGFDAAYGAAYRSFKASEWDHHAADDMAKAIAAALAAQPAKGGQHVES